jgi:Flp pilus assembly secretin CpaC
MEAVAKTNVRHEPSIIPVALTSTAKNDLPPSKDVPATTDALEINNDSQVTPSPSASANPSNIVAVALRNVQTIRLPGKVLQVEIEDDTICRVISTEPNTLTIIGATVGDSKVTVWSTNPTTRASDSQDFRISVRETWGQAAKNSVSIDDVNQSIAGLFPGSEIVIKPNSDGSISVQGTATSNESAKQILMLVRKMFLVPVQDRISIASL